MEEESVTRAARKTAASAAKKPAAVKKPAAKKPAAAKKKTGTTSGSTLRLTAAEKKIVANYRKCNALEKELISVLCEKCASGTAVKDLMSLLQNLIR